jgi:hypothetical protein
VSRSTATRQSRSQRWNCRTVHPRAIASWVTLVENDGAGAVDAEIRGFGALYSLHFVDPDGIHPEVNLFKDEAHSAS